MKKILLTAVSALALALPSRAQLATFTNLISPQTVNGTVTGGSVTVYATLPTTYYQILDGNITNAPNYQTNVVNGITNIVSTLTNAIVHVKQISVDGANWISFRTNYPGNTNGIPTGYQVSGSVPIYMRDTVTTTNALTAGLLKQN